MSRNRKNVKGSRRGNERKRRAGRHLLSVKASGKKKGAASEWGGRLRFLGKWGGSAALAALLLYGAYRALDHFLFESPKFKLATVDYQTDGYLTRARVLDAAGVQFGENLLRIDLDEVRSSLLAEMPVIKDAEIVRDLPDRIEVKLTERRAVAWLADLDRTSEPSKRRDGLLLDAEGVVVPCERLEQQYIDLPVIFSDEYPHAAPGKAIDCAPVQDAIRLLVESRRVFDGTPVRIEELHVINRRYIRGLLNTNTVVEFDPEAPGAPAAPDDGIARQADDLMVILDEATRRGKALATVDVRPLKNIPVTFVDDLPPAPAPVPRALPVATPEPAPRALPVAAPTAPRASAPPSPAPSARKRVYRSVTRSAASSDPAVRAILGVD